MTYAKIGIFLFLMYLVVSCTHDAMICKEVSSLPTSNTRVEYVDGNEVSRETYIRKEYQCKYTGTVTSGKWEK